ncbi:Uncharacterised protein [Pseudomonas luteola]|uniref:Uncharacterized protein n=1 Tax=Pseudomonas luteola TaxID=47886 RepID=A0A2X2C6M4_PSELU|nr:hypothetical protein [Pseudomonas luteola]SPZ02551.1 Uncharacterised protein [Pseudomonas luteola]
MRNDNSTNGPRPGDDDFHAIIAALRYWQQQGMCDPVNRSDGMHDLATNGGEVLSSLDDEAFNKLVVNLSFSTVMVVREEENQATAASGY